jgi:hypothetical protein
MKPTTEAGEETGTNSASATQPKRGPGRPRILRDRQYSPPEDHWCNICERGFTSSRGLTQHDRVVHLGFAHITVGRRLVPTASRPRDGVPGAPSPEAAPTVCGAEVRLKEYAWGCDLPSGHGGPHVALSEDGRDDPPAVRWEEGEDPEPLSVGGEKTERKSPTARGSAKLQVEGPSVRGPGASLTLNNPVEVTTPAPGRITVRSSDAGDEADPDEREDSEEAAIETAAGLLEDEPYTTMFHGPAALEKRVALVEKLLAEARRKAANHPKETEREIIRRFWDATDRKVLESLLDNGVRFGVRDPADRHDDRREA